MALSPHGRTAFWGVTPACNLAAAGAIALAKVGEHHIEKDEPLNIICSSANDCRHLMKTIADDFCADHHRKINFYVLNPSLENTARDLLLLSISLDTSSPFSLYGRCETFLEIFGNLLIREVTKTYLRRKCEDLIRFVTNDDREGMLAKFIDLSHLKYKDRDNLELIFKSWSGDQDKIDLPACWDVRMRRDLEARYDTRQGAFDWDFSMNLCELGAKCITAPFYHRWRESGLAFVPKDESVYTRPNPTLVTTLTVTNKSSTSHLVGYWGDMLSSPYIAFGIGEDVKGHRKVRNDVEMVPSAELSQLVLMDYLYKIENGKERPVVSSEKRETATLTEIFEAKNMLANGDATAPERKRWTEQYKIILLSPVPYSKLAEREIYQSAFDVAYIGGHSLLDSVSSLTKTLRPNASVLFETPKFLIGFPKDRFTTFQKTLTEKLTKNGFKVAGESTPDQDYLSFVLTS